MKDQVDQARWIAVLTAFVCMIPIAGSFLVWLPLSIYLMINGSLDQSNTTDRLGWIRDQHDR